MIAVAFYRLVGCLGEYRGPITNLNALWFLCRIEILKHSSIIQSRIASGTRIISDGWRACSSLSSLGYTHDVIIHEENFVSPENSTIHIQKIRSTWSSLKRFLRAKGTNRQIHNYEYICECLFRRKFKEDVFENLLNQIRNKYSI